MAQFDVFKNPRGGLYPFLLDVQTDLLGSLATRIVVPMIALKKYGKPITRLHPTAPIAGVEYVLKFHDLAAVPANVLVHPIDSLAHRRVDLIAALDLLFTGV
jgi:toxin CcdB